MSFVVKFYDDKTKHFLPVASQCSYRHRFGIVDDPDDPVCRPKAGRPSENMVSDELRKAPRGTGCHWNNSMSEVIPNPTGDPYNSQHGDF